MPLKRKSSSNRTQDSAANHRRLSPRSSAGKRGRNDGPVIHHPGRGPDEQAVPSLCLLHRQLTGRALSRRASEAADTLQRDGFVVFRQFLSSQALRSLRHHVNDVYQNKAPGVDGEWILNLHQQLPRERNWMWALATAPFIVKLLQAQLGPNIVLYCSQLHCKRRFQSQNDEGDRPGFNSAVPWHQDGGANVRTLWIALDPVSPHTGGLKMLKRGHKLGRLPYAPVTSVEELAQASYFAENNVFRVDDAGFSKADVVPYTFPAGGAAMHHPLTPHSSGRNCAHRDRRVIILRYHGVEPTTEFKKKLKLPRFDQDGQTFTKEMWLVSGECQGATRAMRL